MNAVLSVHGKFQGMVREVFGGHQRFHSALDRVGTQYWSNMLFFNDVVMLLVH